MTSQTSFRHPPSTSGTPLRYDYLPSARPQGRASTPLAGSLREAALGLRAPYYRRDNDIRSLFWQPPPHKELLEHELLSAACGCDNEFTDLRSPK